MPKKLDIQECLLELTDLEGSLDGLIDSLTDLRARESALGYTNFSVRENINYDRYEETSTHTVEIWGTRKETDLELADRDARQKRKADYAFVRKEKAKVRKQEMAAKKRDEEKAEFERLKRKFGE